MIDAIDFKNAMSLLTGGVTVITTAGEDSRHGFTASSVCSVTDTPPTLLVCMNRAARSHPYFIKNKLLAVNVLGAQHVSISKMFSSPLSSEERFQHETWTTLITGAPVLDNALTTFDCQIESIIEEGTHSIFICRIIAIQKNDQQQGLVYFNRAYHSVGYTDIIDGF